MAYYDVNAILTDAEKVPCQFELDVPGLGSLDNSSTGLHAGTQLPLPLWMVESLALAPLLSRGQQQQTAAGEEAAPLSMLSNRRDGDDDIQGPVRLGLPASLRAEVMAALKADARAVPLHDQSAHFFAFGATALPLLNAFGLLTGDDAVRTLRASLGRRAAELHVHSRGVAGEEGAVGGAEPFLRGLDEWERALFLQAHEGCKSVRDWMESLQR